MSSENHLTIRDYFDQLFVGHRASGKYVSPSKVNAFKGGRFQQMLASRQRQLPSAAGDKTTGLTIADYRANPVRARYSHPLRQPPSTARTIGNPLSGHPDAAARIRNFSGHVPAPPSAQKSAAADAPASQKSIHTRQQLKIERNIHKAARKYDLSPALIKGVIRAESNFQVKAVSRAGARGLMQLMPATARELGVSDSFDIAQNIDGGCRYLRKMLDSFDGDVKLALAAYNAGPGAVIKYGGQVPFRETRQYVDRVLRFSSQMA